MYKDRIAGSAKQAGGVIKQAVGTVGGDAKLKAEGIADEAEEGERLAKALGNHQTLLMGNHGVTSAGDTVAEAFEDLDFFERAAKTLILAY